MTEGVRAVASGGFQVTPNELDEVAEAYKAQGDAAWQALDRFQQATDLPDSAFGNLPQSKQLAAQYQEMRGQVTDDMTKLFKALLTGYANLAASAANYRTADHLSTIR
jgi:uncharacterized protein YukE